MLLPPGSGTNIEVRFNPMKRLEPFKEDLNITVAGSDRKLLTITWSCQGIEMSLASHAIPFGSVCEGKSVLGDVCRYVKPMYSLTQERNEQCSVCVVVAGRNAIEGTLISILSFSHYAVTRTTCAVVAMTRLQRC